MADRAKYWQRLVTAWEKSGLSQAEFCRRRGVKPVAFGWWKRRLVGAAKTGPRRDRHGVGRRRTHKHADFVEVSLPGSVFPAGSVISTGTRWRPVGSGGYEIVLNNGRVIRLPHNFNPEVVAQLIAAVESC